jgi:hypothetical protein
MKSVKGQRIFVKFFLKVGKTAAEACSMLREAYASNTLGQTTNYN